MRRSTPDYFAAFNPETTAAMATALDQVCNMLNVKEDQRARQVIAERIVELARRGERDPGKLRDRVVMEAGGSGF